MNKRATGELTKDAIMISMELAINGRKRDAIVVNAVKKN
jgi:hypothetical protein